MKNIEKLMMTINSISHIPFNLKNSLGAIYTSSDYIVKTNFIEKKLIIFDEEFTVTICKENKVVLPLLVDCIENSIKNELSKRNQIIIDAIEGKTLCEKQVAVAYPFLLRPFSLITIRVIGEVDEILNLLKEGYIANDIIVTKYEDNILVLGILEDAHEHALSIKETIQTNYSGINIVSYCKVNSYIDLDKSLNSCNKKIELAIKFNIVTGVINEESIIFEDIVDSLNEEKKNSIINDYKKKFAKLDKDMIKTIEVFFNNGLNISESAKELYIHRNTLIYRLDKISKYTSFDIRDFSKAAVFKIIFFIWREDKKIRR